MKERPILFSATMVRAILDGRKTQTRRILKGSTEHKGVYNPAYLAVHQNDKGWKQICPYGKLGDQLWVRETWANYQTIDHVRRTNGRAFSEISDGCAAYRADGHDTIQDLKDHIRLTSSAAFEAIEVRGDKWIPSIHMPRWASRIDLLIKDIRVERLQDISQDDARTEGIPNAPYAVRPDLSFKNLWEEINGDHSWEINPWVWVIEFERIKP